MTLDPVDRPTLLLFAERLEARALPGRDPNSSELWNELVERQHKAELALAQQLQTLRLPALDVRCARQGEAQPSGRPGSDQAGPR